VTTNRVLCICVGFYRFLALSINLIRLEVKNEMASGIKVEERKPEKVTETPDRTAVWIDFAHYKKMCL